MPKKKTNKSKDKYFDIATNYARNCINGSIPACIEVQQACKRFLNDLQNPKYYYNSEAVNHLIGFISLFHFNNEDRNPFVLADWQVHIVCNVYGICNKKTKRRKYRYSAVEIPRKNGKSELLCILATYHLIYDNQGFISLSANSREQIKLTDFPRTKAFCWQLDPQEKDIIHYMNHIQCGENMLINTANNPDKLDGLKITAGIIDEIHEAKDLKMYNIIKRAMGSAKQPILHLITTSGYNTELPYYKVLRENYKKILAGEIQDEQQFCIIYTLDPEDDYRDAENWYKANPNLGISKTLEYMEAEVLKATNSITEELDLKVKDFNIWMQTNIDEIWITSDFVSASMQKIDLNIFQGQSSWAGIDLAEVSDFSAFSLVFHHDSKVYFKNFYYMPENSKNTKQNRDFFNEMAAKGYITMTPGNVVDYDIILNDLKKYNKQFPINKLYYDRHNGIQLAVNATQAGIIMEPLHQSKGNYNKGCKEFKRLIMSNGLVLEENPVTAWMIANVIMKHDDKLNEMPDRSHRNKKIDGVMSMLMGLTAYIENQVNTFAVF